LITESSAEIKNEEYPPVNKTESINVEDEIIELFNNYRGKK